MAKVFQLVLFVMGFSFRGQDVAVVGGGDTAAEEALYLSKLTNKVHLIIRRDEMRASVIMQNRIKKMIRLKFIGI